MQMGAPKMLRCGLFFQIKFDTVISIHVEENTLFSEVLYICTEKKQQKKKKSGK